jgi:hypothetical protein
MTTALPYQDLGRSFIHSLSRITYNDELRFARWRQTAGLSLPSWLRAPGANTESDVRYWSTGLTDALGTGGGGGR